MKHGGAHLDHNDAETLARGLMEDHGLFETGWSFKWDRALKRFGFCQWSKKVISLSWHLVGMNDESHVRNIILHEIAHALAPKYAHHGPEWKRIAVSVGCTGDTCYDSTVVAMPKAAWVGTCPCGTEITRQRRTRGLYHMVCRGGFTWKRND